MDSFLTVSKASSNRALDMPASYVSTLRDGEEIFVESYGRKFVWDTTFPSGTATVDGESFRPSSWSSNGAFVAVLIGSPKYWRQSAWFVSTTGDDENDGLTSATPLKTDAEIQRRWGTPGQIAQPTVIAYTDSPTSITNIDVSILAGGSIKLLGVSTTTSAQTFSAVDTQVRTAGAEVGWAVTGTGLGASVVGRIIEITASGTPANVGAYATILKDLTGGKVRVSPFGKAAVSLSAEFATVTPQVGDTFVIHTFPTLTVGTINVLGMSNSSIGASPITNCAVIDLLNLSKAGTSTVGSGLCSFGASIFCQRVTYVAMKFGGVSVGSHAIYCCGGGFVTAASSISGGLSMFAKSSGFLVAPSVAPGGKLFMRQDCYFQGVTLFPSAGAYWISQGTAFFDGTTASIFMNSGASWTQAGGVQDWGVGNTGFGIVVSSGAQYNYQTKPTINSGLGAGRETRIGGTDKLYSAVPFIEPANNAALVLTA